MPKIEKSKILQKLKLKKNDYFLVTAHRSENVDNQKSLKNIFSGLEKIHKKFGKKIIYPIHPRTTSKMKNIKISQETHNALKEHCDKKGLKIGKFVEQSILISIKKDNKSE